MKRFYFIEMHIFKKCILYKNQLCTRILCILIGDKYI